MANFGQLLLTNLGMQAQYKAQSGEPLKFKRIGMGSGNYSGNIVAMTNLVNEEVSVDVSKGYIQNNAYTVEGVFTNDGLQTGFAWREIGLFVEDASGNEILYCYANAGDTYDYIPATDDERYSKHIRIATVIGNATDVSIVESEGILYVDTLTFQTAIDQLQPSPEKSGKYIALNDSANLPLLGLNIYGNSTQYRIPAPDAPVDIVSTKDQIVTVCGKNVLRNTLTNRTTYGITATPNREDGSVTLTGTATGNAFFEVGSVTLPAGTYVLSGCPSGGAVATYCMYTLIDGQYFWNVGTEKKFTLTRKMTVVVNIRVMSGVSINSLKFSPMVRLVSAEDATYESHIGHTVYITNTLKGIPVSYGGNYTDENGQQWICDEIDFERGVYVQRIGNKVFDGSSDEIWYLESIVLDNTVMFRIQISDSVNVGNVVGKDFMCSHLEVLNSYNADIEGAQHTMQQFYFRLRKTVLSTEDLNGFRAFLGNSPMSVDYVLRSPIETSLPKEQIVDYKNLVAYNPYTTVLNDSGAWMKVQYFTKTFEPMVKRVGNVSRHLLWENASGFSNFASQTIDIAELKNYNGIEIEYANSIDGTFFSSGFLTLKSGLKTRLYFNDTIDTVAVFYNRLLTGNENSETGNWQVTFENATQFRTDTAACSEVTNVCIPYRIYGIKGVEL